MKRSRIDLYRCPGDHSKLTFEGAGDPGNDLLSGFLVSEAGRRYPIENGIPNLIYPPTLSEVEAETKAEYDRVADDIYDRAMNWQFEAFHENEDRVRETMLTMLDVQPGMRVLEIGCGTGRDSYRLALRLGDGELHMQDLSLRMVEVCRERMSDFRKQHGFGCTLEYSASNGGALPYADGCFDAIFHFGGFNHFGDLKQAAAELARVVKVGGRVLFGDEAVAPWLKGTQFDGIVSANNALFKADIPLTCLPQSARDVNVRWLIANCFYVIAFSKGEGAPSLDLDLPHTGVRGGSMRSRYFGILEGVSQEAKDATRKAAAKAGLSIHEWLDARIRQAAQDDLDS